MDLKSTPNYDMTSRLAVEALRNGVPNWEAVKKLGCNQPKVEERFQQMLDNVIDSRFQTVNKQGMLVSGGFGAGKSHLLTYLEQIALSRNFVCSRVPISKETPLYDLGKVFVSAMENGRIPDRSGRFIEELALKINQNSERYEYLSHWADNAAEDDSLSRMFSASLCAYTEAGDHELNSEIESFWAGQKLRIANLRRGLNQIGKSQYFRFRAPRVTELPPQQLQFAVKLIKSVGYHGWVVLLDEIELIGSYSILQRGRSYAEIARWMGLFSGANYPGLIVVGAVTDDFASAIISPDGQKKDRDYVRPRLENNMRLAALAPIAEKGMQELERNCIALESPDDNDINVTMKTLQSLYRNAYDWDPPTQEAKVGGAGFQGRMRHKVRSAINEWDLRRLIPDYEPDIEIREYTTSYATDNSDLESSVSEDNLPP